MIIQTELAQLLDRTPAAVSQATREGHICGGYPVQDWAIRDRSGRVSGYVVPNDILTELECAPPAQTSYPKRATPNPWSGQQKQNHSRSHRDLKHLHRSSDGLPHPPEDIYVHPRTFSPSDECSAKQGENVPSDNVKPAQPSEASPVASDSARQAASSTSSDSTLVPPSHARMVEASSHTSLLPAGEDYARTVASGGAAYALATASQYDTPTARVLVLLAGTAGGALLGHHIGEDPASSVLGGLAGFLTAWIGLTLSTPNARETPTGMDFQPNLPVSLQQHRHAEMQHPFQQNHRI